MNVHATLLNQLEAFEARFGVRVVPVDGAGYRLRCVQGVRFYWGIGEDYCQLKDAHAHIREGAMNAVMERGMFLLKSGGMYAVVKDVMHAAMWYPTTEDALSGALAHILKEKAE